MNSKKNNRSEMLRKQVIEILQSIYDPEIPVNIYDLGLIYDLEIHEQGDVEIEMTLTSPMCPVAESLPLDIQEKVLKLDSVQNVKIEIVWDPPWSPAHMSQEAKLELNLL